MQRVIAKTHKNLDTEPVDGAIISTNLALFHQQSVDTRVLMKAQHPFLSEASH